MPRFLEFSREDFPKLAVLVAAAGFVWFHWVTRSQYGAYRVFLADTGVFDALCYGPWHGNWLKTPLAPDAPGNYFGVHFQPFVFLITPLYLFSKSPMPYLFVLTLGMAAAALPLMYLAAGMLGSRMLGLLFGVAYFANHFVASIHLANHPESLVFLPLFTMFFGLEKRDKRLYAAGLIGALLIKEDLALFTGLFGLSLLFPREDRRWGLVTIAVAAAWGVLAWFVMRASGHAWFQEAGMTPASRFASFGNTPGEILAYAAVHPGVLLRRFFSPALLTLVASVGFLCLLDWRRGWVGLAGAGVFLICDDELIRGLNYYYSYAAMPFLFYSALRGARWLKNRLPGRNRMGDKAVGAVLLVVAAVNAALPTRTDGYRHLPFRQEERHALGREIARSIPADAAVCAQFDLYCQVPHRKVLLPLRLEHLPKAQFVFLDFKGRPADLIGRPEELRQVLALVGSDQFRTIIEEDGFLLRERVSPER